MTTEDIALIVTGMIVTAGVFACGVLIGTSLRKDLQHGNDDEGTESYKAASEAWHRVERR